MRTPRSSPLLVAALVLASSGCVADVAAPEESTATTGGDGLAANPSSPPDRRTAATLAPDEVLPGCPDATARERGNVVGGVDVDGDGAKDVIGYIGGERGTAAGDACAALMIAYTPNGLAGFTLEPGAAAPSRVTSLQPGGEGTPAYVSFRTVVSRDGYRAHLLALAGSAPDLRLVEVRRIDSQGPLLPFVADASPDTRAGFLCSDGDLVGQVGLSREEPGGTVWDVTTTTYDVVVRGSAARATPRQETAQKGVPDAALKFGYPALLPESSARTCS